MFGDLGSVSQDYARTYLETENVRTRCNPPFLSSTPFSSLTRPPTYTSYRVSKFPNASHFASMQQVGAEHREWTSALQVASCNPTPVSECIRVEYRWTHSRHSPPRHILQITPLIQMDTHTQILCMRCISVCKGTCSPFDSSRAGCSWTNAPAQSPERRGSVFSLRWHSI